MAFKTGVIIMSPDADPTKHRGWVKTPMYENITVIVQEQNYDQAADACKDLVQKEGVQAFILCPSFTNEGVAKIQSAVGPGVPVNVARGDVPADMITGEILAKEGWFK